MSRLGGGVVDANLKHRKTALQFDRALLRAFLRAELGLQRPSISRAKPDFGQFEFGRAFEILVVGGRVPPGYGESGGADKPVVMAVEAELR